MSTIGSPMAFNLHLNLMDMQTAELEREERDRAVAVFVHVDTGPAALLTSMRAHDIAHAIFRHTAVLAAEGRRVLYAAPRRGADRPRAIDQNPAYRRSMLDAGRGRLLR